MPNAAPSLYADLGVVRRSGSPNKRVDTLRRVTNLFLNDADRLNDKQVGVFDEVREHPLDKIEAKTLAEIDAGPRHRR